MKKKHHKKNKETIQPKENIQELSASRDGGQVALRGYSYQFLYSCYFFTNLFYYFTTFYYTLANLINESKVSP